MMTETIRWKSILVKLLMLSIAIWLVALVLPATFAEQTDVERNEIHAVGEELEDSEEAYNMLDTDVATGETNVVTEESDGELEDAGTTEDSATEVPTDETDGQDAGDADLPTDEAELDGEEPDDDEVTEEVDEVGEVVLLSLTREEFNNMTREELEERVEEGGYADLGFVPGGRARFVNACPNVDGSDFVTNTIVGGIVCVGAATPASGTGGTLITGTPPVVFGTAWRNNAQVTQIVLMENIQATTDQLPNATATGAAAANARTASITIDGNGYTLTLASLGTAANATSAPASNPVLFLGAAPATRSTLILNNINFRRVHSQTTAGTGDSAIAVHRRHASARNIFSTDFTTTVGAGAAVQHGAPSGAPTDAATANTGFTHSRNWDVTLRNNVTTGNPGTTLAEIGNISGLLQAPHATLRVEGTGNRLNMHAWGDAGTGMSANGRTLVGSQATTTHQLYVQEFEMLTGAELSIDSYGAAGAAIRIENQFTEATSGAAATPPRHTTITVQRHGSVILQPSARLLITNGGTRNGLDVPTTGVPATTDRPLPHNAHGRPFQGHGIHGFISTFTMEADSYLHIDAVGVGFRSRSSTNYTMRDGAVKTVYARGINAGNTDGNEAWVLANSHVSGLFTGFTHAVQNEVRRNVTGFSHNVNIYGEGTTLNLTGYANVGDIGSGLAIIPPTTDGGTAAAAIGGQGAARRSNSVIMGANSTFTIRDGAAVNNNSRNSTAMLFSGNGSTFNVNMDGLLDIEVNGSVTHNTHAFRFIGSGGSQTFNLNGGEVNILATARPGVIAERGTAANGGTAGLLGAGGGGNGFYVSNRGVLNLEHQGAGDGIVFQVGRGLAVDTSVGHTEAVVRGFILENATTPDRFVLNDYRSEVRVNIANGVAISGAAGVVHPTAGVGVNANNASGTNNTGFNDQRVLPVTRVEVNPGTIFEVEAYSPGDAGIFRAGRLQFNITDPLYFDFTNTAGGNARIFRTGVTQTHLQTGPGTFTYLTAGGAAFTQAPSTIEARSSDLALWRNTRAAEEDAIDGEAAVSFHNTNFHLRASVASFAHVDLTAPNAPGQGCPDMFLVDYTKCAWDGFREWFNGLDGTPNGRQDWSGPNRPLTGTGANAGWSQIRRMSANNARPVIDVLRTPTDADQRVFGHITIQEGNRSARSAFTDEVFVDVEIRNAAGLLVQTIYHAPTAIHSIWDNDPHMGVFEALVDFTSPVGIVCPSVHGDFTRMDGTEVICSTQRTDDTVHTTEIHRPFPTGTAFLPADYTVEVVNARRTGTAQGQGGIDGITGATPRYRMNETSGMLVEQKEVHDITPPLQVDEVVGFIDGDELFSGAVTNATTSITGTGEEDAIVRIARVTLTGGNVTGVAEWLNTADGTGMAIVDEDGDWEFIFASGVTLNATDSFSIYISDDEQLTSIPAPPLPEVIYHRSPGDTTLNSRSTVNTFTLPRTAITAPWDPNNATIGNINFHYDERYDFHDATEDDGFDYAYMLDVNQIIDINFRWNYPGNTGNFEFDEILSGDTATRPPIDPSRGSNYIFMGWFTTATGNTPFDFNGPRTADTNVYAQWLGRQAFEFTKTDHRLYDNPRVINPLPGAEFTLEREVYEPSEDCAVYNIEDPTICDEYEDGDYIWLSITDFDPLISATNGQVTMSLLPGSRYRLTEIAAPALHDGPEGHWYIETPMDITGLPIIERSFDPEENPPVRFTDVPFVRYNGNWYVGNMPSGVGFTFVKTNEYLYETGNITHAHFERLEGAEFLLERWNDDDDDWEYVERAVSEDAPNLGRVMFETLLTMDGQYRLIEEDAPTGYVLPEGHWYIEWNTTTEEFVFTNEEADDPFFIRIGEQWFVGNMPGLLSFTVPDVLDFDDHEIELDLLNRDLPALTVEADVIVTDNRPQSARNREGWHLTARLSERFANNGTELISLELGYTVPGDPRVVLPYNVAMPIFEQAAGGTGGPLNITTTHDWGVDYGFSVVVRDLAELVVGEFEAEVTWTLTQGPANTPGPGPTP